MKDEIVRQWFERGEHDLVTAKISITQEGYPDVILFLLHQAIEKYIKGYLLWHGWELKKIHDLETLLTEAMEFDKGFEKYLDFGRRLTAYYYEERYPPGPIPEISKEETDNAFKTAEGIINVIKNKVNLSEGQLF